MLPVKKKSRGTCNLNDSYGSFPIGRSVFQSTILPVPYSYSPFAMLLPFIEQSPVHSSINFSQTKVDQSGNTTAMATAILGFLCPSDSQQQLPVGEAGTNYRFSEGTTIAYECGATDPTGYNAALPAPEGPFFDNTAVTLQMITDGTSNTAAISEKLMGDFNPAVATPNRDIYVGTITPTDPESCYQLCQQVDPTSTPSNGESGSGVPWIYGDVATSVYKQCRCLVAAVPVLIVLSWCGSTPAAPAPDQDAAKQTLERALSSWQKGETVDAMAKASPSIKVLEPKWERGDKLTKFELKGPGKPKGGQQAFQVTLSLQNATGKQTNEMAEYRVGTDRFETVTRLEFD
jgi:hypothetical protein